MRDRLNELGEGTEVVLITFTDPTSSFNNLNVNSGTTEFPSGLPTISDLTVTFGNEVSIGVNSTHTGALNAFGGTLSGPGAWTATGPFASMVESSLTE